MISDGFRSHHVGWMITTALESLEKCELELYAYSTNTASDNLTRRIQAATSSWMSVQHLSDDALAQRIRDDHIDVLIDLCGHNTRSEEHTSELQSLMRISYAVFCLNKKNKQN